MTQVRCRTSKTRPDNMLYILLIIFQKSLCKACFFECFITNIFISSYVLKTCWTSHNFQQYSQIESFFNEPRGIIDSPNAGPSLSFMKLFSFLFQVNHMRISARVSVRAFALTLFNSNHPSNIVFLISFQLVTSSYVSSSLKTIVCFPGRWNCILSTGMDLQ